jgi:hypothetical protein
MRVLLQPGLNVSFLYNGNLALHTISANLVDLKAFRNAIVGVLKV